MTKRPTQMYTDVSLLHPAAEGMSVGNDNAGFKAPVGWPNTMGYSKIQWVEDGGWVH